ncbi:50S ribosomal protein L14e [Candidatus Woesearchaeota archaeon]|nr:MAG: 50S ribosomal protein L14e [Candidatus Woesearchaeota archaeon]
MKMIEVGRICVKIAGRDAGRKCVVVDILDDNFVLIDGSTRRRKCNFRHLEPTAEVIKIKKGASHEEVAKEFEKLGLPVWNTKPKPSSERPRKQRGKRKKAGQEGSGKDEKKKGKKEPAVKAEASKDSGKEEKAESQSQPPEQEGQSSEEQQDGSPQ